MTSAITQLLGTGTSTRLGWLVWVPAFLPGNLCSCLEHQFPSIIYTVGSRNVTGCLGWWLVYLYEWQEVQQPPLCACTTCTEAAWLGVEGGCQSK